MQHIMPSAAYLGAVFKGENLGTTLLASHLEWDTQIEDVGVFGKYEGSFFR